MAPKTLGSSRIRAEGGRRLDSWMYPYRGAPPGRPWRCVAPQIALLAAGLMTLIGRSMIDAAKAVDDMRGII